MSERGNARNFLFFLGFDDQFLPGSSTSQLAESMCWWSSNDNIDSTLSGIEHRISEFLPSGRHDSFCSEVAHIAHMCLKALRKATQEDTPSPSLLALAGMRLGTCITLLELDALRLIDSVMLGDKVRAGGRRGSEIAHGDPEAKRKRYQAYQSKFDALRAAEPERGHMSLCDEVAMHFGVHPTTIYRRTTKPKRKVGSPPTVQ